LSGLSKELGYEVFSLLLVPLIIHGKRIGVLQAVNKIGQVAFTDEDVVFMETLAAQAAIAIRNRELSQQAEENSRKAAEMERMKIDFIAILSHELRTPLGVILGHASMLQETCSESYKEDVEAILRNAMRLSELLNRSVNLNRFEKGYGVVKKSQVDLNALLQNVTAEFSDLVQEKQVEILLHIPRNRLRVTGDTEKIALIIRCLLNNALTFTDPSGKILLRLESVPGYVKVTVMDNGIGIPKEEQEKIFQRFYQVEKHLTRRHGGLGLGLSIAKEMVELHGGRIWVESQEGAGSRFIFILPVDQTQAVAAERVFLT